MQSQKWFSCIPSLKNNIRRFDMIFIFFFTLTFDLYVILIGQGTLFIFKWSDVFSMYGSIVLGIFNKIEIPSGAVTA